MIHPLHAIVLTICTALLALTRAPASVPLPQALADAQPPQSSVLARHGLHVLRAQGSRLEVYRLDNDTLREIGSLDALPGHVQDIASQGERVFIALRGAELERGGGVATVDLRDPTRPNVVAVTELGPIRAVGLSDAGMLYAVGPGEESDYRVELPGIVRTLRPTPSGFDLIHELHFFDNLADLSMQGDRLFLLEERLAPWSGVTTIRTVDITDPASPRKTQVRPIHSEATALEITDRELLVASGESGLHRVPIDPSPQQGLGAPQRWDPPGCVSASASRGDVTAILNPCAGSVTFVTRAPRIAPLRTVTGLGAVSDALWWDDRLLVAGAPEDDIAVLRMELAGQGGADLAAQHQTPTTRIFLPFALADIAPAKATRLLRRATAAGSTRAIAATEERIYAGEGEDLVVLSAVEDGMQPLGRLPNLGGDLFDLEVQGSRLYAAAGPAGLIVWDLDEVGMPVYRGRISTGDWAMDVEVIDGVAFVAALDAGLQSFDIDGTAPRVLQSLPIPQRALRILRKGDALYVAPPNWWGRTSIVDASDARNARLVGQLPNGSRESIADARLVLDDRLYALGCSDCLEVFDISRPLAPIHLSTWMADSQMRVDGIYLTTFADETRAQAWLGSAMGISILDLAEPTSPRLWLRDEGVVQPGAFARQAGHVLAARDVFRDQLGGSDTDPSGTHVVSDGIAAIRADDCCEVVRAYRPHLSRVRLFPSGNAGPPRYANRYSVPKRAAGPQRIETETFILDPSDPLHPSLGARVASPLEPDLQIAGDRGYQLRRASPEADLELQVLSLADPVQPLVLGTHAASTHASFYLIGPELGILVRYESTVQQTSTLQWLDLGDPRQVQVLDEFTVDGNVGALHADGERTWFVRHVRDHPSRVQVLSRSPNEAIRIVQDRALPPGVWSAQDIKDPVGDAALLYVATSSALYAAEISSTGALRDWEPISGRVYYELIEIDANRWLGIGDGTVLLDTGNPRRPYVLAELDPSGQTLRQEANHAAVHGSWIYLGKGWDRSGGAEYTEVVELR